MSEAISKYYAELGVQGLGQVQGAFARVKAGFGSMVSGAQASIGRMSGSLLGLLNPTRLVGAALAATGVLGVRGIFQLAAQTEALETQFRVLLGSAGASKRMMQEINDFAAATPFDQMELAETAKQLIATGSSAAGVVGEMRQLGDIAALSGARLGDLAAMYGKIRGQGKLTAETVDQFATRGIPLVRQLAAQFGVSEAEIRRMVSAGKIGFADVQQAIGAMTGEGGQFAGGMAELSKTVGGLWSTVVGNFKQLAAQFGTLLIDVFNIKGTLADLGNWFSGAGKSMGNVVRDWLEMFKAVGTVIWEAFSSGIAVVWEFGMSMARMLGIVGDDVGESVMGWVHAVQFWAENWKTYSEIAGLKFMLMLQNVWARVSATFQHMVIIVQWAFNNWRDILWTYLNLQIAVWTNIAKNIRAVWTGLLNWFAGRGFHVDWTPLLDGFESTIKEMPKLVSAEVRASTPELDRLYKDLEKRRAEFLDRKRRHREPGEEQGDEEAAKEAAEIAAEEVGPAAGPAAAAGAAISQTGLAQLAQAMQEEVGKRLAERQAAAAEQAAQSLESLAAATHGDALRVEVVGGGIPATYAP